MAVFEVDHRPAPLHSAEEEEESRQNESTSPSSAGPRQSGPPSSYVPLACKIALSVGIYSLMVAAIPIYSKEIFDGSFGFEKFVYPCTAAALQVGTAGILMCLLNLALYNTGNDQEVSWVFGPHFRYKVTRIAPAGLAFGLKYAVTNVALSLVDNATHVLLGATQLIWVVLLAMLVNRERPGIWQAAAVAVSIVGNFVVALSTARSLDAPAFPLFMNLFAPFVGAFCISTLRTGVATLFDPGNRLGGAMTKVEFVGFKLVIAGLAALASAMVLESGVIALPGKDLKKPWWSALATYPLEGTLLILASSLLTVILHVNLAWFTWLTSATAVGVLSEVKVLPQWTLNQFFSLKVERSPLYLLGAGIGILGSCLYAAASHARERRPLLALPRVLGQA